MPACPFCLLACGVERALQQKAATAGSRGENKVKTNDSNDRLEMDGVVHRGL